MSHTIIRKACFIRLSDHTYVPILETAESNVCDSKGRRCYSIGSHLNFKTNKLCFSISEMDEHCINFLTEYKQEKVNRLKRHPDLYKNQPDPETNFSYYTGMTFPGPKKTYSAWLKFLENARKNATDFETAKACGLKITTYQGENKTVIHPATEEELTASYIPGKSYLFLDCYPKPVKEKKQTLEFPD